MKIDQERVRAILQGKHAYYGGRDAIRTDGRWYPAVTDLFAGQLTPDMRVLDVGCGNGDTLLEIHTCFSSGVGIDNDPEHIQMAEADRRARGIQNVEFLLLDFPGEIARFQPESFDLVFSQRGPLSDTQTSIEAALSLLRPDGLLFCEEIGESHQREANEIFTDHPGAHPAKSRARRLKTALERAGVDVRLVCDVFTKWIYPDVYAWLQFQSNIWAWSGRPLPDPGDPRIELFAERNTSAAGEIVTTHHVVRAAGVKTARSAPVGPRRAG